MKEVARQSIAVQILYICEGEEGGSLRQVKPKGCKASNQDFYLPILCHTYISIFMNKIQLKMISRGDQDGKEEKKR